MIRDVQLIVDGAEAGQRLDRWLVARFPAVARAQAEAAAAAGAVLVNGRRAAKGQALAAGDAVLILQCLEKSDFAAVPDATLPLHIVYSDDSLLACDKPAGMPVHPQRAGETGTLVNALLAHYPELAGLGGDVMFPAFVHRIDTGTSGLVLAARTPAVYEALRTLFSTRQIHKEYLALVHGRVGQGARLEDEIAHHPAQPERMMRVTERNRAKARKPMRAVTTYTVAEPFDDFTLLRVVIETGVTHQIRCQLAAVGHAVVGDPIYGATGAETLGLARHFLHAARLEFAHPVTGAPLRLEAPLPKELDAVLALLRTA
jgi:23S rRNA pseudouridine1911/1915/1917 synthase